MNASPKAITSLLVAWCQGDQKASDQLFSAVYDELRRLARSHLRHERPNHSLLSSDLVHEAYLRLIDQQQVTWQNRAHFFGIASKMMRRILVNHALARRSAKRGGALVTLSLNEAVNFAEQREVDLVALDDALKDLEKLDPRQCQIVELRFFGGLSIEETAEALGFSPATISREWNFVKLWLHSQVSRVGGKHADA